VAGSAWAGALWLMAAPGAALFAALAGLALAGLVLHRPGAVPVLVYHSVSPDAGWLPWADNTSVRPEAFRLHLEMLRRGGWTVLSTRAFVARRRQGAPMDPRAAVLHFDDGYLDNHLFAAPLLREYGFPATFFASVDFIDPSDAPRALVSGAGPGRWRGYMNAAELRELDADPLFDVEAHGTNHARHPLPGCSGDRLTDADWRRHAPLAWAHDPANKSRWFEAIAPPPPLRLGDQIPLSDSALTARYDRDGAPEDDAAWRRRVGGTLAHARRALGDVLGRPPEVFAWPFDRCSRAAVELAREAGFSVVTGGLGENRAGEDPGILSRVHVQDRAFGDGPLWLEGLAFRARVNAASGRLAWQILVALAARLRRRRFGRPGYGAAS
jgi:peptidoglycan/xylan/chitin deacetylase (PgdA/CDA1 family)